MSHVRAMTVKRVVLGFTRTSPTLFATWRFGSSRPALHSSHIIPMGLPMNEPLSPDGNIEVVVVPRSHELGDNFEVRRALPSRQRRMVGPYVFLDQMGPHVFDAGQGLDVRPHPHIGLATVTYLYEGEIVHRDS